MKNRVIQLFKVLAQEELSYSFIMRYLNKNDKDKLEIFMKSFKKSFDEANIDNLEDADKIALMSAMKEINYKGK